MGGRCGRDAGRPGRTDPVGRAGMGGRTSALSTLPMTAGETPEALLRRATELQRAGRVREAIETSERLLAVRPDLPDRRSNLGRHERASCRARGGRYGANTGVPCSLKKK